MVKCEKEKNEENGERGGGRRFCSKEGGGHVWLGVIREVCGNFAAQTCHNVLF